MDAKAGEGGAPAWSLVLSSSRVRRPVTNMWRASLAALARRVARPGIHHCRRRARECSQMGKRPLTNTGGIADHVGTRLPRGSRARIDALVRDSGLTRGEFMRTAILNAIEDAERREVDAKAS
jgi:hypothetical protein